MPRDGNSLLGVGGQRKSVSRAQLRGGDTAKQTGAGRSDPLQDKRDLLRRMQQRSSRGSGAGNRKQKKHGSGD
ncbi:hypothetical protein CDO52_01615 [Nocardiopsis gilva YIM 90087]|uniref:Uncharacterized protein n=1 Tax=Nocardiopsis gilva YIM 90087 TaxID=1235441 RepID=A0A223S0M1_9ACTN|nr:DUF6243 family protein [Nocardiopsis gilva]ASU81666.1 hypothetical protein CDO52_01615 [Nocardiopsis gilva YIM 90087]